jgi:peptide/nickel transport system substrate-binding protein
VVCKVVAPERAAEAVATGQVDFVPIARSDLGRVGGAAVVAWPHLGYHYLGVNQDLPLFADRRVRQALLYGINRQGLVPQWLNGRASVVNTHLAPGHWAAAGVMLHSYPHDLARAATLLTQAGWSQFSPDGVRMRDGMPLAFTLKAPRGREGVAAAIQRDLRGLGVKVTVEPLEFAQLTREVFGARQAEAWLLGWRLGVDPDPGPLFAPDNKWGRASGWLNRRSGELLGRGARTLDPVQRKAIYGEWAQLINTELPYLLLYAEDDLATVRTDRVRGVKPDLRGPYWNISEWWIPKEGQR